MTSKTETLRNFQCLSGGENLKCSNNLSFRPKPNEVVRRTKRVNLEILGNYLKL